MTCKISPLVSHSSRDTFKGAAAVGFPVWSGRHAEYALLAALYDVGGHERRQAAKPKTRSLGFSVAEHPGLDDLRRLRNAEQALGMAEHDRVFDRDHRGRRIEHQEKELSSSAHLCPAIGLWTVGSVHAGVEVLGAAVGEIRAFGVGNDQIPAAGISRRDGITLDMERAAIISRDKIIAPGIVTEAPEGGTDNARTLACNEDAAHMGHPAIAGSSAMTAIPTRMMNTSDERIMREPSIYP